MPQIKSGPLLPRESLYLLYMDLNPELDGKLEKSALARLAVKLSKIAHKEPPWSWKYLSSILRKHKGVTISAPLSHAIEILGAMQDGLTEIQARAHLIQAYSLNGNVKPGSIILGKSKPCNYSRCQVEFVPRVPWQTCCCPEHTRAAYRERKANETS